MSEVVHVNDLPTVCTVCSSGWCLSMKYSLCRMRTLWVTPQWGSMGPTCGRVSNGWKEWVLMMQFVCNGWMSLFQKVVWMRWSPEVGVPKETRRMVLLCPLAFCWFTDSTVVQPKLCVSMWGVWVYFYLPVSALKELNRFVEEIGKQRNNCYPEIRAFRWLANAGSYWTEGGNKNQKKAWAKPFGFVSIFKHFQISFVLMRSPLVVWKPISNCHKWRWELIGLYVTKKYPKGVWLQAGLDPGVPLSR